MQVTGVNESANGQVLNFLVTSDGGSVFANVVLTVTSNSGPYSKLSGIGGTRGPSVPLLARPLSYRAFYQSTGAEESTSGAGHHGVGEYNNRHYEHQCEATVLPSARCSGADASRSTLRAPPLFEAPRGRHEQSTPHSTSPRRSTRSHGRSRDHRISERQPRHAQRLFSERTVNPTNGWSISTSSGLSASRGAAPPAVAYSPHVESGRSFQAAHQSRCARRAASQGARAQSHHLRRRGRSHCDDGFRAQGARRSHRTGDDGDVHGRHGIERPVGQPASPPTVTSWRAPRRPCRRRSRDDSPTSA